MMSVDETLLCSFQVCCTLLTLAHHLTGSIDLKASGEESKVPLWRDEHGSTSNTAPQAKEEGRQDGLRTPQLRRSTISPGEGTFLCPFLAPFVPPFPIPFHPFHLFMFLLFDVAIRC